MITLKNVTFKYKKENIFNDFSLTIEEGKVHGLLGKNGAGKSTLLYLMTGLLIPQQGKIEFDEMDVSKRIPCALSDMFIVPEEFSLPPITLKEYIKVNKMFYPHLSQEQLKANLDCFDMTSDVHLNALSLGQKKKVFMSFALATNTSLLVMDEPTNGLDIPSKSQFRKFIASGMNDDKTILISTHQVQDVDKLLDHVIILDDNKVLLNTTVQNICNKLRFVISNDKEDMEKALHIAPSILGNNLILPNTNGEETLLNLEALFNATLSDTEKITACFN